MGGNVTEVEECIVRPTVPAVAFNSRPDAPHVTQFVLANSPEKQRFRDSERVQELD